MAEQLHLKLYVTDMSGRLEQTVKMLEDICSDLVGADAYKLEIIDIRKNPDVAELDRILVTPTLVKHLPPPLRRVIGDLSSREKVLVGLDFHVESRRLQS